MQNSSFNFASVFAIMVLLVFSYITFLGLAYWQEGNLLLPVILSLGLIVVVCTCVFLMCKSKASRWKRIFIIGQAFFGIITLATLLVAALPFSNFINVVEKSEEIKAKLSVTYEAAENLDNAYVEYVDGRINQYREMLNRVSLSKNVKPSDYEKYLSNASGPNDEAKIENLTKSLRSKLMPESTAKIVNERHDWLKKASSTSVWNPLAAANISKIGEEVDGWEDNYSKLSSVMYDGENAEEFSYGSFNNELSGLTQTYNEFHRPTPLAIIISLICFIIMMLPYLVTEKSLAAAGNKNNDKPYE